MNAKHVWIYFKSGTIVELDMEPASYEALIKDYIGFIENERLTAQGIKVYGADGGTAKTVYLELSNVEAIEVEGAMP